MGLFRGSALKDSPYETVTGCLALAASPSGRRGSLLETLATKIQKYTVLALVGMLAVVVLLSHAALGYANRSRNLGAASISHSRAGSPRDIWILPAGHRCGIVGDTEGVPEEGLYSCAHRPGSGIHSNGA